MLDAILMYFSSSFCVQLSGAEKPPAGEPENSSSSSAAAAGTEAADGGSKVATHLIHRGSANIQLQDSASQTHEEFQDSQNC